MKRITETQILTFQKSNEYKENCQCCVIVHEARLRGIDVSAVGFNGDKDSTAYKLMKETNLMWQKKDGSTPSLTIVKGESDDDVYNKLEKATSATGRYHIGINHNLTDADKKKIEKNKYLKEDDLKKGHIIVADRTDDGKMIFYDPQNDDFINIRSFTNIEYFDFLKVDKLNFNIDMLKEVAIPN